MKAQDLKNSILQLAIQGKLVEQREEEGTARELIEQIQAEKEKLIKEKKIKKEKPLPEITEDEKPFDIPESWEWVRLGDLGITQTGNTPSKTKMEYFGDFIPFISPGDILNGEINYGNHGLSEQGKEVGRVSEKNSILQVCIGGSIGKCAINSVDVSYNQQINAITPLVCNHSYIYYLMDSRFFLVSMNHKATGTATPIINKSSWESLFVPIPPLEEQKRIVAKIEELMPYVDQYDKAYTEVEELNKKFPEDMQKSILQYAIQGKLVEQREEDGTAEELYQIIQAEKEKLIKEGKIKKTKPLPEITEDEIPFDIPENWKWVRLGDVFDIIMGQSPKGQSVFEGDSGVEFHQGKVYFGENYLKYSNQSTNKPTKIVEPNTVLLCVRAPVGILNITARKICIGRGLCGINTLAGIDPKFVMNSLRAFKYEFIRKATGTTFVAITGEVVKTQLFPLPPLEEQKRILKKIEELLPYTKQLVKKID